MKSTLEIIDYFLVDKRKNGLKTKYLVIGNRQLRRLKRELLRNGYWGTYKSVKINGTLEGMQILKHPNSEYIDIAG